MDISNGFLALNFCFRSFTLPLQRQTRILSLSFHWSDLVFAMKLNTKSESN